MARQSVEEFREVNPISSPVHSPGISHCKANVLPKSRESDKMEVLILSLCKLSEVESGTVWLVAS